MKHILATLAAVLLALCPAKATNIDSWTNYFSYYDATEVIEADGMLYSIISGNLMSYDLKTTEVRHIDRISNGLSSKGIKLMGYSDTQHTLVIVYNDGNIDLYNVLTDHVTNIPQFRDNPDSDFGLNNIKVQGDEALIATNEGILAIDVKHSIIIGRYPIGKTAVAIHFDGRVYAALISSDNKTGNIISISADDNLLDRARWEDIAPMPVTDMGVNKGYLYVLCPYNNITKETLDHGIWALRTGQQLSHITGSAPTYIRTAYGNTIAYGKDTIVKIDSNNPLAYQRINLSTPFTCIYPSNDGGYWTTLTGTGLTHYVYADGNFTADSEPINGGGPNHETPYYLRFIGDRLFVAAGRLDMTDKDHRPFNASWYDADADEWHYFEVPYGGPAGAGPYLRKYYEFCDATSVAQDPLDPTHHFVTSGSQGIFEYRDSKLIKQYTEQRRMENGVAVGSSVIKSSSNSLSYDYVRTNAAIYDKDGNLFIANSGGGEKNKVDTIVWCLKRDGSWKGFYYPLISDYSCFENSIFDAKGRLWITQRRTAGGYNGGFLCMDFNGTLDNTSDDVYTYRSKFTNQDGMTFTFQQALAIAEDKTGRIWLGTETGLIVVDDPDKWASPDFTVTQIKVPRPDGIYADYLLAGTTVTAIAVDGANRKWIGTQGDGIYLVSADGITTIHHFTRFNSPLVSDNINAIACHPTNGEVFIGTDLGLMSYHSDASEYEETLARDNLRVYPNPVRPDYSGPVVLDGLVYDSDVKVVSTSGHVVAAGTSVGGTFTWNGRGPSGNRVGSGIYYFMVASPDGRETTVAKVAVVR